MDKLTGREPLKFSAEIIDLQTAVMVAAVEIRRRVMVLKDALLGVTPEPDKSPAPPRPAPNGLCRELLDNEKDALRDLTRALEYLEEIEHELFPSPLLSPAKCEAGPEYDPAAHARIMREKAAGERRAPAPPLHPDLAALGVRQPRTPFHQRPSEEREAEKAATLTRLRDSARAAIG